jgi:hypothetical protein
METLSSNKQNMEGRHRMVKHIMNVLNILPALWIGLFVAFVLATWLEVGHIPTYGNPDPKFTLLAIFFVPIIYLLLPVAIVSIPVWGILAGMGALNFHSVKPDLRNVLLIVIPILIFAGILQTGLGDWFID